MSDASCEPTRVWYLLVASDFGLAMYISEAQLGGLGLELVNQNDIGQCLKWDRVNPG